MIPPIAWRYEGDGVCVASHKGVAERHLTKGDRYIFVEHALRSQASHNHEFAWLAEAWKNLPERLAEQYPSPEHLRKRALIETGFYLQTQMDVGTNAAALRAAAFLQADDVLCVAVVRGSIVIKRVAESQSQRAMGGKRFGESKAAILEWVAALIEVTPQQLVDNTARAA